MQQSNARWTKAAAFLVLQLGCAPDSVSSDGAACPPGSSITCSCDDGSLGSARCNAEGNSVGVCQCGVGAGPSAGTAGGPSQELPPSGGSQASSSDLPCDVKAIMDAHCATCHGKTTAFGAPMSLVSAADFRASIPKGTGKVGERVLVRIKDDALPMPPPPNPRLSAADQATLANWIGAGAPAGSCASPGPGQMPAGADSDPPPLPPDVTCYQIKARATAAGDKYTVPTTPDLYRCFDYAPPWGDKTVQVVSARPIIDNSRVLHHWILYNGAEAVQDGNNAGCSGAHPNASFITGWAPGGDGLELPADVGLRTEGGGFSLEIHYNNTIGEGQLDASGVDVCVTEKLRPKEAAVHWLGTQNLNKVSAAGTCVPVNTGPVTILTSSPHMHLQGRHMKTVINRKAGASEVLIDTPFDFNTQVSYPTPAVINPGDTLTTTCTYAMPTPFGQKTNEEMCYNFVVAYPAGQLAQFFQLLRRYDCTGL